MHQKQKNNPQKEKTQHFKATSPQSSVIFSNFDFATGRYVTSSSLSGEPLPVDTSKYNSSPLLSSRKIRINLYPHKKAHRLEQHSKLSKAFEPKKSVLSQRNPLLWRVQPSAKDSKFGLTLLKEANPKNKKKESDDASRTTIGGCSILTKPSRSASRHLLNQLEDLSESFSQNSALLRSVSRGRKKKNPVSSPYIVKKKPLLYTKSNATFTKKQRILSPIRLKKDVENLEDRFSNIKETKTEKKEMVSRLGCEIKDIETRVSKKEVTKHMQRHFVEKSFSLLEGIVEGLESGGSVKNRQVRRISVQKEKYEKSSPSTGYRQIFEKNNSGSLERNPSQSKESEKKTKKEKKGFIDKIMEGHWLKTFGIGNKENTTKSEKDLSIISEKDSKIMQSIEELQKSWVQSKNLKGYNFRESLESQRPDLPKTKTLRNFKKKQLANLESNDTPISKKSFIKKKIFNVDSLQENSKIPLNFKKSSKLLKKLRKSFKKSNHKMKLINRESLDVKIQKNYDFNVSRDELMKGSFENKLNFSINDMNYLYSEKPKKQKEEVLHHSLQSGFLLNQLSLTNKKRKSIEKPEIDQIGMVSLIDADPDSFHRYNERSVNKSKISRNEEYESKYPILEVKKSLNEDQKYNDGYLSNISLPKIDNFLKENSKNMIKEPRKRIINDKVTDKEQDPNLGKKKEFVEYNSIIQLFLDLLIYLFFVVRVFAYKCVGFKDKNGKKAIGDLTVKTPFGIVVTLPSKWIIKFELLFPILLLIYLIYSKF